MCDNVFWHIRTGWIYCTGFNCSVLFGTYERSWWHVIIDKYAETQQLLLVMPTGAYWLEKCWSEVGNLVVTLDCWSTQKYQFVICNVLEVTVVPLYGSFLTGKQAVRIMVYNFYCWLKTVNLFESFRLNNISLQFFIITKFVEECQGQIHTSYCI